MHTEKTFLNNEQREKLLANHLRHSMKIRPETLVQEHGSDTDRMPTNLLNQKVMNLRMNMDSSQYLPQHD